MTPLIQSLIHDEQTIRYALLRHPARKRLTLRVTAEGEIEARAPVGMSLEAVERFVRAQAEWLEKTRRQMLEDRPTLGDGTVLTLLDEPLTLRIVAEGSGRIRRAGSELRVPTPLTPEGLRDGLERWYRQQARRYLTTRLRHWSDRLGVSVLRLTIRGQSSRWGSCSRHGAISLNWQLMLLPPSLVDYVMVHELCHRREMNHSPAFWAEVAAILPDYAESRKALQLQRISWL
ncbi:MAG: M48 family metallopeptidase [Magnetococcales bacterium]|nr:M48 family metallopeptidase [Magnetococcales bacterium]